MYDRTLTERLEASTGAPRGPAPPFDRSVLMESVLENIRRVFNERRGSCEIRADYGMPDLNDVLGHGGTPTQLALLVQEMLQTFEPRISDPIVRFEADPRNPLNMNFRVSAVLHFEDGSERISFD